MAQVFSMDVGVAHTRGVEATHLPPAPRTFNHGEIELTRTAPEFALPGVDGDIHTLDEYADADALVIFQIASNCPYVRAWEGRMKAIHADYVGRNVAVVAINSNAPVRHLDDLLDGMIKRAKDMGFEFDYLRDEDQSVARALGSTMTPEVFVFDRDRALAYHGMIDDSHDETTVTQHYLRDALDALLEGSAPPVADVKPRGCLMKWPFPAPTKVDLSGIRDAIDGAWQSGYPIGISYIAEEGGPELVYDHNVQVLGSDQLALYVARPAGPDGEFLRAIAIHPEVTLVYQNLTNPFSHEGHIYYKLKGRARIDDSVKETVYSNLPYVDATYDPEKRGVAVVIDVDSVRGNTRFQPVGRSGPVNMAR